MKPSGDFRDNDWEPSEAEEQAVLEEFRRSVLWEQAMAEKGIKVLSQRLTPQERHEAVAKWWGEEGAARHGADKER